MTGNIMVLGQIVFRSAAFFLRSICILFPGCAQHQASPPPVFSAAEPVTISGHALDAMEPFLSGDGRWLFFNSLNDGEDTSLYYAERESDTVFVSRGKIGGVNGSPPHLDAVASMDDGGRFVFVSTRDYPGVIENLQSGFFADGTVEGVAPLAGDFYIDLPGWIVMDAEISRDGNTICYVNARIESNGLPGEARIGIARRSGTAFLKDPQEAVLLAALHSGERLCYAPALSADGRELYYTGYGKGGSDTTLYVAVRDDPDAAFGSPVAIPTGLGLSEAATISRDGKRLYFHAKPAGETRYRIFLKRRQ